MHLCAVVFMLCYWVRLDQVSPSLAWPELRFAIGLSFKEIMFGLWASDTQIAWSFLFIQNSQPNPARTQGQSIKLLPDPSFVKIKY